MTTEEYWRMFELIRRDIDGAVASNTTYFKIHNLGASDSDIAYKYHRTAEFWNVTTYSLQTTFFIAFGRIFDRRSDSFSVQGLVEATIEHPGLFAKNAVRERKREASKIFGTTPDPPWLTEYIERAWEPARKDLEPLRDALSPYEKKVKEVYRPLRHAYFAHRGQASEDAIAALFGKTLIVEVAEILTFLYTLVWEIRDMADNAKRPDLTNFRPYQSYVEHLEEKVEKLIRSIA
jgi:hypothetical protein